MTSGTHHVPHGLPGRVDEIPGVAQPQLISRHQAQLTLLLHMRQGRGRDEARTQAPGPAHSPPAHAPKWEGPGHCPGPEIEFPITGIPSPVKKCFLSKRRCIPSQKGQFLMSEEIMHLGEDEEGDAALVEAHVPAHLDVVLCLGLLHHLREARETTTKRF